MSYADASKNVNGYLMDTIAYDLQQSSIIRSITFHKSTVQYDSIKDYLTLHLI